MARAPVRLRSALLLCACAALAGALAPATATADQATGTGTGVAIPTNGPAVPGAITLSGVAGEIAAVRVTLTGLRHFEGSDLDILLVSPGGATTLLVSDVCAGSLPTSTLTLDDTAAAALPASGCSSGTFRPRNSGGSDSFSSPAPAGPYGATLAALAGDGHATANGTWRLYVQDDRYGSTGTLSSWSISVDTIVHVPATGTAGVASAYPWDRVVTTAPGSYVRDVDIVLTDLSHRFFGEVSGVVQGPDGRATVLFAGACGNAIFSSRTLRFDDAALDPLPISNVGSCWNDPAYRPMDPTGTGAPQASPAPIGAGTDLTAYEGRPGDGTWRLWLADGGGGDTGTVRSWAVESRTSGPAPVHFQYPVVQGREGRVAPVVISRSGTDGVLGAATVTWQLVPGTAGASDASPAGGTVAFARGQTDASVPLRVVDDGLGGESAEHFGVALTAATGDASVSAGPAATVQIPADLPAPDLAGDEPVGDGTGTPTGAARDPSVAAEVVVLPPASGCVRLGRLTIRFKRPRGRARVTRVQVIVNGRTVRRQAGGAALRAIQVAKLKRAARYKVVVRVTLSTKRVLTLRRTYRACAS